MSAMDSAYIFVRLKLYFLAFLLYHNYIPHFSGDKFANIYIFQDIILYITYLYFAFQDVPSFPLQSPTQS